MNILRKISLFVLIATFTLSSCEKSENLKLSTTSCVLDNETSYVEVKVLKGSGSIKEGSIKVTSSLPDVAQVRFDEQKDNIFYIVGNQKGDATVLVTLEGVDDYDTKKISVQVREKIIIQSYAGEEIYIKVGESRLFNLPFNFDAKHSLIVEDQNIISVSTNVEEIGQQYKIDATKIGTTHLHFYKGITHVLPVRVHVVNEYDLFFVTRELTFKLPFTYGINGIVIWRGSGQYSAKIEDESVAEVKTITRGKDSFNKLINSATVAVNPLSVGRTKMIITDMVTKQTSGVWIKVN